MEATKHRRFFAVLLGVTILAGLIWTNNVSVTIKALSDWERYSKRPETLTGWLSIFDPFCVDLSTMATFIPFLGFLLIARGLRQIYQYEEKEEPERDQDPRMPRYFPFVSRGYASTMITLGLIGTIWGLILIGYGAPEKLTIERLILCMYTALWSTLIALIWVFLCVPLAKRLICGSRPETVAALSAIRANLAGFSAELVKARQELSQIKEQLGLEALPAAKTYMEGCNQTIEEIKIFLKDNKKAQEDLLSEASAQREATRDFQAELTKLLRLHQVSQKGHQTQFEQMLTGHREWQKEQQGLFLEIRQEERTKRQAAEEKARRLNEAIKELANRFRDIAE